MTRKRTFKRKFRKGTRKRAMTFPKRVKRIVLGMEEKKFFTNTGGQVGLGTDYTLSNVVGFSQLAQGVTRDRRIGSKIVAQSLYLKIVYNAGSVGGAGIVGVPCRIRFLLILDKQYNGAASPTAIADLFTDLTSPAFFYYQHLNPSTVPARYRVMWDRMVDVDIQGGVTDQSVRRHLFKRIKLGYTTTYRDQAISGNVTDIEKNALFLYVISDQTALTVPSAGLEFMYRFTDLT